ncbi:MAG: acyl-CoA dehydrogenase family protein [Pseudomonadota bacterium]
MYNYLLDQEGLKIRDEVRDFVKSVPRDLIRAMDEDRIQYPREFVRGLGEKNLLGLRFPKEYGGRGHPWTDELAAMEEVGVLGAALGCAYAMPSIVGEALTLFGTPEQKEKFLRPMLAGKLVAAEALTEPRGGSDFFGATTKAKRVGNEYEITGTKRFIVGAQEADFFIVYVRTGEEGAKPHQSISLFIVERQESVKVEYLYGLMGTRGGGTGRVVFKNVRVPEENLVGRLNDGGAIFNRMMIPERMTSAGGALGGGRAALEVAARYTARRKAFGRVIREFEGVSFRVAESVARLDAARALAWVAARSVDSGRDSRRIVSEAKKVCTEAAWDVVNNAMQVMGGIAYTTVYPVERLLRDCRLMLIWTGTNEIMNLLVQHEYYKELLGQDEKGQGRDIEMDCIAEAEEEKVFD